MTPSKTRELYSNLSSKSAKKANYGEHVMLLMKLYSADLPAPLSQGKPLVVRQKRVEQGLLLTGATQNGDSALKQQLPWAAKTMMKWFRP
ncbi:RNA exonuclease [Histoplasma capsulatum]|uniref:RNA exonuclease n=1 Tax=Ajellomyces capsulatus TaxID=5037 RepID=A0A8A1MGJ4_AJECA|nr:RNA exonuclease [Histoplasma capsulatum]